MKLEHLTQSERLAVHRVVADAGGVDVVDSVSINGKSLAHEDLRPVMQHAQRTWEAMTAEVPYRPQGPGTSFAQVRRHDGSTYRVSAKMADLRGGAAPELERTPWLPGHIDSPPSDAVAGRLAGSGITAGALVAQRLNAAQTGGALPPGARLDQVITLEPCPDAAPVDPRYATPQAAFNTLLVAMIDNSIAGMNASTTGGDLTIDGIRNLGSQLWDPALLMRQHPGLGLTLELTDELRSNSSGTLKAFLFKGSAYRDGRDEGFLIMRRGDDGWRIVTGGDWGLHNFDNWG